MRQVSRCRSDFGLDAGGRLEAQALSGEVAYIALGSNIGDRAANIERGLAALGECGSVLRARALADSFYTI